MRPYSSVRRMTQQSKRLRIAGTLVLSALVIFGFLVYYQSPLLSPCDSAYANVYDVVIDAGSTGSRVHVFQYERGRTGLVLLRERFKRVEPGLSSFATDPDGAKESLAGLLRFADKVVPQSYQKCTFVTLKATAGLRLLPESVQQVLLDAAQHTLNASPFQSRGASIISGAQEGVYGWLTVNYLLNRLDTDVATVATIDMGGASTQVVFETTPTSGEWLPFNYAHQLRTPKRTITMYQHSYLGLGMNEAKKKLMMSFAEANGTSSFPCFPRGYAKRLNDVELRNSDATDFDACAGLFHEHVITKTTCKFDACGARGVPQPLFPSRRHLIYAFSYFYDRLYHFSKEGSPVYVSSYKEVGQEVCHRESARRTTAPEETACMELAYMYSFLTYGLGLSDATALTVPNRIEGMAVSWSLGSSLSFLLKME
ncbi:ATP diphosphohydrolase [Leishmania donovani]|uniref:ATP diphosphohydrolase n=1 Tax=Leishmania donovani TaxID=5661 RepID=A0A3Q8I8Z5_LEIDO|nr:ATP diphosphohydrolase [Leishmania donovani]AYU77414.1 ATP diphosphohydrolase [Leishmania donovani]TPP47803.1 GDA1/CD39 (nucleoside phosphatase) family protein [Leishmania donovani]CBZ32820.1 ATP diphosphohydrolase [Leishmania donovani]